MYCVSRSASLQWKQRLFAHNVESDSHDLSPEGLWTSASLPAISIFRRAVKIGELYRHITEKQCERWVQGYGREAGERRENDIMKCLMEIATMEIEKLEKIANGCTESAQNGHSPGPSSSVQPFTGLFSVERLLGSQSGSPLVASSPHVEAAGPLSSESPCSSRIKPILPISFLPRDQVIPTWDMCNLQYLADRRGSIANCTQIPLLPTAVSYDDGKPAVRCPSPRSRTTSATSTYSTSRASSVQSGNTRALAIHEVAAIAETQNGSLNAQQTNGTVDTVAAIDTDTHLRPVPVATEQVQARMDKKVKKTKSENGVKRPPKMETVPLKRARQEEELAQPVQPAGQEAPGRVEDQSALSDHDQAYQSFIWSSKRFKIGSQMKVYEGVFEPLNLPVAVKVQEKRKQKPILPLLWEAELLRQIDHPAFIEFFSLGALRSFNVEIVELFPHHTLEQELAREGHGLHEQTALDYLSQIIDGINYLHGIGVAHRNLNLDAILIGEDDNLKIGQLTMSLAVAPPRKLKDSEMKTPAFLAPEVLYKRPYLRQGDFWSIGVIFFKMIFNELPFVGTTAEEILESVKHGLGDLSAASHKVQTLLHMMLTEEDDRADLGTLVRDEFDVCKNLFGQHAANFRKGNRTSGRSDKVPLDHKVVMKLAEIFEVSVSRVEQSIERRTYNEIHAAYLVIKNNEKNGLNPSLTVVKQPSIVDGAL